MTGEWSEALTRHPVRDSAIRLKHLINRMQRHDACIRAHNREATAQFGDPMQQSNDPGYLPGPFTSHIN
jgi:hypothetical protein